MKKPEKKQESVLTTIEVSRAYAFDNGGVVFDAELNGISIYGLRVVEGSKGDFISFPARQGKDGKYYNHVWVKLTDDDTKQIISQVEKKLSE